jgi:hypothetical protein
MSSRSLLPHPGGSHAARTTPGFASAPGLVPPTVAEVERALRTAYRRLAVPGIAVALAFERITVLPPRIGRAGVDAPPSRSELVVHPVRVRCTVHCGPDAELMDATYRFWRTRSGGWGFTGPLALAAERAP